VEATITLNGNSIMDSLTACRVQLDRYDEPDLGPLVVIRGITGPYGAELTWFQQYVDQPGTYQISNILTLPEPDTVQAMIGILDPVQHAPRRTVSHAGRLTLDAVNYREGSILQGSFAAVRQTEEEHIEMQGSLRCRIP
jgi:hypothetical protein